jgi:hypothetical protein
MTKETGEATGGERRCGWCRRPLPTPKATGRPRRYCSQACRQWDYVTRRGNRDVRITEEQLVLARSEVDALHDAVYVLSCAVDDAERDLAGLGSRPTAGQVREILEWVLDNARPLARLRLRPE